MLKIFVKTMFCTFLILMVILITGTNHTYALEQKEFDGQVTKENYETRAEQSLNLERCKINLEENYNKMSSDLIQLLNDADASDNTIREQIRRELKSQSQLIQSGESTPQMLNSTAEDLVHVYVQMNAGSDINTIKPLVSKVENIDENNNLAVAWVEVSKLDALSALSDLKRIRTIIPPRYNNMGSAGTQGDSILQAELFRNYEGVNGTGIKVGVISDGVNHWKDARDTGDLPANLHVLSNTDSGDEGTALLEIIYDLAPGAELYFHDGGTDMLAFNHAVDDLVSAGCNIICDDIAWFDQPYFEDGIIAKHIASVIASHNIVYVSAAGNYAQRHYQGLFYDDGYGYHDFSYGYSNNKNLYVNIPPGGGVFVVLEWADKFGASNNDYDLYMRKNSVNGDTVAYSTDDQNGNGDPIEGFFYTNDTGSSFDGVIDVKKYSGTAKNLELYVLPFNGTSVYRDNITASDSIFGHEAVTGVITVGAIDYPDTDTIANYSSQGPVTITYPTVEIRNKPDICGLAGVNVSGAGSFSKTFYGTSAAAPHVAAIAALAWSTNPSQTAAEVRNSVVTGADDLYNTGYDYTYGYGRANATGTIPDLQVPWIYDSGVVTEKLYNPTIVIKNNGKSTNASFYLDYYLSNDNTLDASDIHLLQQVIDGGMPAKSYLYKIANLTLPDSISNRAYYLFAVVDSTGVVGEMFENNNIGIHSFTVNIPNRAADLIIQSIEIPLFASPGNTINVTDTIYNRGITPVTQSFVVQYYLSKDSQITNFDTYLGMRSVSSLASLATNTATTNLYIPSGIDPGSYFIGAIVDCYNYVIELDESNNSNYDHDQITIIKPPKITSISPDRGPYYGGTTVTITGSNLDTVTGIYFGGKPAISFAPGTAILLTAIAPAGTGTVDITAINPVGTSAISTSDEFRYISPPTIISVDPMQGADSGDTPVRITGSNLDTVTEVLFGNNPATRFYYETSSAMTAVAPASTGVVHVTVINPGGTSPTNVNDLFSYVPLSSISGIISTVAGHGSIGYSGDGGPATSAQLNYPRGVTFDKYENMYIADSENNVIRMVTPSGIISSVAGDGKKGYTGDGGPATSGRLYSPYGLAFDNDGNMFIADTYNHCIRKVDPSGIISTVAGNGTAGYSGDGGSAISAQLYYPFGLAFDNSGNMLIADSYNNCIRKIDDTGIISTVAGIGEDSGYSGDGGPAVSAKLGGPSGVACDNTGNMLIVDPWASVIRKVDSSGMICTIAGNFSDNGYSGDGGPAKSAKLNRPYGAVFDSIGNIFIADCCNYCIRKVDTSGKISTIAGVHEGGYSGDQQPSIYASLYYPFGVTLDNFGNMYIADTENHVIRKVIPITQNDNLQSITAVNGKVNLILNEMPVLSPTISNFTITRSINGADGIPVIPTIIGINGTQVTLTVPVVKATSFEQMVVYSVSYQEGESVAAQAFIVPAQKQKVVATPTVNPPAGTIAQGTVIKFSTTTEGTTIYYTSDGTVPTEQSMVYDSNQPIILNENTTIKAIGVKDGMVNSDIMTASYTIGSIIVNGVSLTKTAIVLAVGGTEILAATIAPTNATNKNLSWSSDKPSVAEVNNGIITAVSEGIAVIIVTTEDGGKTATCTVTVTAGSVKILSGYTSWLKANDCSDINVKAKQGEVTIAESTSFIDGRFEMSLSEGVYDIEFSKPGYITRKITAVPIHDAVINISGVNNKIGLIAGDLNSNGIVNPDDYTLFLSQWRNTGNNLIADFTGDGLVNPDDYAAFLQGWRKTMNDYPVWNLY